MTTRATARPLSGRSPSRPFNGDLRELDRQGANGSALQELGWLIVQYGPEMASLRLKPTRPELTELAQWIQAELYRRGARSPALSSPAKQATPLEPSLLLTIPEVAHLLQVHSRTVKRRIAAGDISAVQLGPRCTRVTREALTEYIARLPKPDRDIAVCVVDR